MSTQILNGISIQNYPVFEGSQVLTSDQLNNLFQYLDQQNRFTRSKLIGIGVVCGLELQTVGDTVRLTSGLGITSEGFLINMPDCEMNFRREYSLPQGVFYDAFGTYDEDNIFSQDNDIVLHELLSVEPEDTPVQELDAAFFNDKYFLLFLECFDRDPRSCLGKNCEDLGKERIFTMRKLAVSKSGLDKILEKQDNIIPNPYHSVSGLRHVDMPKPLFHPKNDSCTSYESFYRNYADTILGKPSGVNIFEELFGGAEKETGLLYTTYEEFEPLLSTVYNYNNPLKDNTRFYETKEILNSYLQASEGKIDIQLIYEYITIVINAYHEFASLAETLVSVCKPEQEFPLHLILGKISYDTNKEADEIDILGESRYRQNFIQPRIHNSQNELRRQLISRHKRLILILESFAGGRVRGDNSLKITPTVTSSSLGDQSISMALLSSQSGIATGIRSTMLSREWSYELTTRSRGANRVLSYDENLHVGGESSPDPKEFTQTPLYYNHKEYSYKVEGFFHTETEDLREMESAIKDHFNLPFDTLKLHLGSDTSTIDVEAHYWTDLQSDFLQIKSALIATVRNLLGELKAFKRTVEEWTYEFDYANVGNFKKVIREVEDEIDRSLGLCEEGEKFLTMLPDRIEKLHNNGSLPNLFSTLLEDYKSYRRNLSVSLLKLEYSAQILTFEKVEVLDPDVYHDWMGHLHTAHQAIKSFLSNNEFFQLFSLYYRFVNRYNYLQQNHYSLFCNFLNYHPGIEQKPIDAGGTHIILYEKGEGDSEVQQPAVASFNLPYRLTSDEINIPLDPSLDSIKLPPLARGESILIVQGDSRCIDVTSNDLDPNGDPLRIFKKGLIAGDDEETIKSGVSDLGAEVIFHEGETTIIRYDSDASHEGRDFFHYIVQNANQTDLQDSVAVEVLVIVPHQKHIRAVDDLSATDSHHSVYINVMENDTTYRSATIELPEKKSAFGGDLSITPDQEILYTPVFGREGKDTFEYELVYNRTIGDEVYIERSRAKVEIIVYCCNTVEFEVICEGNTGYFDVLTERESAEKAKLEVLNKEGKFADTAENENGIIRVVSEGKFPVGPDEEAPGTFLEFQPDKNFKGLQKFTYRVTDSKGFERRVRLHVLVQACSTTNLVRTLRNTPCTYMVEGKGIASVDLFTDRNDLMNEIETINGAASIFKEDGTFGIRYIPDIDFFGLDSLQYAVTYDSGKIHYNTLNIIVDGTEKVRIESVFQDTSETFTVLTKAQSNAGYILKVYTDNITFKDSIGTASSGTADVKDNLVTYTPGKGFSGDDIFRYAILDGTKPIEYGVFHLLVDSCRKVSLETTQRDTPIDITLTNVGKIPHSITIQSGPGVTGASATVSTHEEDGQIVTYTPAPGYAGKDSFNYLLEKDGVQTYGTVYVLVEEKEKLDFVTVEQGETVSFNPLQNVKSIESFEIITATPNGDVRWDGEENVVRYTPNEDFTGTDKLTYKARSDSDTIYGTVIFVVVCPCEAFSVSGTVTDDGGNVLSGVDVSIVDGAVNTSTGPSGFYNINASRNDSLQFSKSTHEIRTVEISDRSTIDVVLTRKKVTVTGTVTEEGGKILPGVLVDSGLENTVTDVDGKYSLQAYAEGNLEYTREGYKTENRKAGVGDTTINVVMQLTAVRLVVTVKDAQQGITLNGVNISISDQKRIVISEFATSFIVDPKAILTFNASGYETKEVDVSTLMLTLPETILEVSLSPALIKVSGTVKDNSGELITDSQIKIGTNSVVDTAGGNFSIDVPLWESLIATAPNFQDSPKTPLVSTANATYLDVRDFTFSAGNELTINFVLNGGQSVVTGTVYNEDWKILGNSRLEGSGQTVISETNGDFQITMNTGDQLVASADGFISRNFLINTANQSLQIKMQPDIRLNLTYEELPATQINANEAILGSFSLGNRVYVMTGRPSQFSAGASETSVHVFDTAKNTWLRLDNFPRTAKYAAVSFANDGVGYYGLGYELDKPFNELWSFNPVTSQPWKQLPDYPGKGTQLPFAFSTGEQVFIGSGYSRESGSIQSDFYSYLPQENTWNQLPDFPGNPRENNISLSDGGTGYVFGGTNAINDLWAYNPKDNIWTREQDLNNMPYPPAQYYGGFIFEGEIFVIGGNYNEVVAFRSNDTGEWRRATKVPVPGLGQISEVCNGVPYLGVLNTADNTIRIFRVKKT